MTPLRRVVLCDPDCIGVENLGTQGWGEHEIGESKVETARWWFDDPDTVIQLQMPFGETIADVWADVDVMFICPDKIEVREEVYRSMRMWRLGCNVQTRSKTNTMPHILIDGRAARYIAHVWALNIMNNKDADTYTQHGLFPPREAVQAPCAERMTIYIANICASLMLHQFAMWTRGEDMTLECLFDVYQNSCVEPHEEAGKA